MASNDNSRSLRISIVGACIGGLAAAVALRRKLPLLPTWIRGRAALLGDAAHTTLPLLGQGAAMAVEEAGALGCLLPAGTRREDVPARLVAYEDIRKQRGEYIGTESVDQVHKIVHGGALVQSLEIQATLLEYDVIGASRKCYNERFGGSS
ncbi:hypothetical protein DFH06DRAFT_1469107 [Mycena polygramma]|nr:hypothetical protein DFH06DRAFT_1469107 [Mycena polygramma]